MLQLREPTGGLITLPEAIYYEAQTDRELLIIVAKSVNSLNEKTADLCGQVKEHERIMAEDRDRIHSQDLQLTNIVAESAEVARNFSETMLHINSVLTIHADKISKLEQLAEYVKTDAKEMDRLKPISKFFWWVVLGASVWLAGMLAYVLSHVGFPSK